MKMFICKNCHLGMWPIGFAAVVFAEDSEHAADMLNEQLDALRLSDDRAQPRDMIETQQTDVHIIIDGTY